MEWFTWVTDKHSMHSIRDSCAHLGVLQQPRPSTPLQSRSYVVCIIKKIDDNSALSSWRLEYGASCNRCRTQDPAPRPSICNRDQTRHVTQLANLHATSLHAMSSVGPEDGTGLGRGPPLNLSHCCDSWDDTCFSA